MKLIATRSYSYNTRRLRAGDEFETTNDTIARALVGARRARYAPEAAPEPPKPRPIPLAVREPEEFDRDNDIYSLRAEAERLGISVDGRWGVTRLQQEIAQAKL